MAYFIDSDAYLVDGEEFDTFAEAKSAAKALAKQACADGQYDGELYICRDRASGQTVVKSYSLYDLAYPKLRRYRY